MKKSGVDSREQIPLIIKIVSYPDFIVVVTIAVQFACVFFSLRLIKVTGGSIAWVLVSIFISLIAVHHIFDLYGFFFADSPRHSELSLQLHDLATSVVLLFGVIWIVPLFKSISRSEERQRSLALHLKESETSLLQAQKLAHAGSWQFGVTSGKITWSQEVFRICGLDPAKPEPTFKELSEICHPDDRAIFQNAVERAIKYGTPYQIEFRLFLPDGSMKYVESRGEAAFDDRGRVTKLFGVAMDITERKWFEEELRLHRERLEELVNVRTAKLNAEITERQRAEEKLRLYQKQLLIFAFETAFIEERERKRLAEELHDNIGQNLALAKIGLAELGKAGSAEDIAEKLDRIQELVDRSIQFTRSLSLELSPHILYELGFVQAVGWLCEQIPARHGIKAGFESSGDFSGMDVKTSVFLFKAIRELLMNIVKHSKAGLAEVSLRRNGGLIHIEVRDDGVGFDPSKTETGVTKSFGLFSIKERIKYLGGSIELKSSAGEGTEVVINAPITEREGA